MARNEHVSVAHTDDAGKLKVLFISGWGRSGSTIIANILGSHPKVQNLGEVRYFWDRGILENRLCGCGEKTDACPLWQSHIKDTMKVADAASFRDRIGSEAKWTQLRALISGQIAGYREDNQELLDAQTNMLVGIAKEAGATVLVDASKTPTHAMTYINDPRIDLRVIHLQRDPRAVTLSWKRKKIRKEGVEGELMPTYSTFKSVLFWNGMNLLSLRLKKYVSKEKFVFTTYEGFVANPQKYINAILDDVDLPQDGIAWEAQDAPAVGVSHSVSGNPIRHNKGHVKVKPDDAYKSQIPRFEGMLIKLFTAPVGWFARGGRNISPSR